MKKQSLSRLLKDMKTHSEKSSPDLRPLQEKMFRVQQGIWHQKSRGIILFEGFDAAGKGGAIRKLTELLDPRGVRVHPIGPPEAHEQGKHWLYRFWKALPAPGTIAVFDRSWYGRVLVERVDGFAPKEAWQRAFREINEFERMLKDDGILMAKVFLAVSKDEQLKRFEDRLKDPYKRWKISDSDIHARKKWNQYVKAVDDMFEQTDLSSSRWHIVPADDKDHARAEALKSVLHEFRSCSKWLEKNLGSRQDEGLKSALKELGLRMKDL